MKNLQTIYRQQIIFVLGLLVLSVVQMNAQDDLVSIDPRVTGEIVIRLNSEPQNSENDPPLLRHYEVIKSGKSTKTVFRFQEKIKRTSDGTFEIKIPQQSNSEGFVRFDIDVSNYRVGGEELNFRSPILPAVSGAFLSGNRKEVILKFSVPKTVNGSCEGARAWLLRAFNPNAKTKLTATRTSNEGLEFAITDHKVYPAIGINSSETTVCTIQVDLALDRKLPVGEKLNPAVIIFDEGFINSEYTLLENPSFAAFRVGIKGSIDTSAGLNEAEKRDDERKVAFEFGGGLTTVKQKEDVTDTAKDRETTGFLDLRLATPTKKYYTLEKRKTAARKDSQAGVPGLRFNLRR